jgi:hypothetical protein
VSKRKSLQFANCRDFRFDTNGKLILLSLSSAGEHIKCKFYKADLSYIDSLHHNYYDEGYAAVELIESVL